MMTVVDTNSCIIFFLKGGSRKSEPEVEEPEDPADRRRRVQDRLAECGGQPV
jgi:hypothetical protein